MAEMIPDAIVYNPLKAGSIDGTDVEPHDRAVWKAMNATYKPNKGVIGDPRYTLFVVRLNPLTTEETLHRIFSKFGKIKRLRLVRDIITGFSKRYAFIEYELEKDFIRARRQAYKIMVDHHEIFVEAELERTLKGWIPRRFGGGLGGKKESGQLRFGGRDRPFRTPIIHSMEVTQRRGTGRGGRMDRRDSTGQMYKGYRSRYMDSENRSGQVDREKRSGHVDRENRSGQVDRENRSGQVDRENRSGHVDRENRSGQVDRENRSGQMDRENRSGQVDRESRSGQTNRENRSGQTDWENRSGQTDRENMLGRRDWENRSGQTDRESRWAQMDWENRSGHWEREDRPGQTGRMYQDRRPGWTDQDDVDRQRQMNSGSQPGQMDYYYNENYRERRYHPYKDMAVPDCFPAHPSSEAGCTSNSPPVSVAESLSYKLN